MQPPPNPIPVEAVLLIGPDELGAEYEPLCHYLNLAPRPVGWVFIRCRTYDGEKCVFRVTRESQVEKVRNLGPYALGVEILPGRFRRVDYDPPGAWEYV